MEIIWFIAGALADVLRSVFVPASTEWIGRRLPFRRREINRQENLAYLESMEKLKGLGRDPKLAAYLHESTESFVQRIEYQKEAFGETQAEMIDSTHMNQLEMNLEADRRARVSDLQLEGALKALLVSGFLDDKEKEALNTAQNDWTKFRSSHAEFEAAGFEGGSMRPLVYSSAYEALTIERIAHLKSAYADMSEMRGP